MEAIIIASIEHYFKLDVSSIAVRYDELAAMSQNEVIGALRGYLKRGNGFKLISILWMQISVNSKLFTADIFSLFFSEFIPVAFVLH